MIRLRIERFTDEEMEEVFDKPLGLNDVVEGMVWMERGVPVGRVVIESISGRDLATGELLWEPVEVIDE